jgi:phospholipase C
LLGIWIRPTRPNAGRVFAAASAVKAWPWETASGRQREITPPPDPATASDQPNKQSTETFIYVLPIRPTLLVGGSVQLQAFHYDRSGVITDITAKSKWTAIEQGIASVAGSGTSKGLATGLAPGEVLVQAKMGALMGFTTVTVVSSLDLPPPGLSANASDVQVALTWTALTGSTTFNVLRATQEGGPYTSIATVSTPSYTDSGLTDGTSYYYVVRAHYQDGGHSGDSHEAVGTPLAPGVFDKIQHVVYIIKENHSFDSMFGLFPSANGATQGTISTGQVVQLQRLPDPPPNDLGHLWTSAVEATDGGRMDRFDLIFDGNLNGNLLPYSEFQQADIPNYWTYAARFVLADAMYSSITSGSYPGHLYIMAAQNVGAIDNPVSPTTAGGWGCDASSDTTVATVTDTDPEVLQNPFPCYSATSLASALQNAGVSWKSYAPSKGDSGYAYNSLRAFQDIFNTSLWQSNVVTENDFVADAMSTNMPAVSWLTPDQRYDEHPTQSVCEGENWTVQQINAIMQGPNWNSTAIFFVEDDFGGFYDHVKPPAQDIYGYSIRVPLIIVSPYAKQTVYGQQGYITHTTYELSSVPRFIEERFGIAPLSTRDATANDTLDTFDFSQAPLPPLVLHQRTCP